MHITRLKASEKPPIDLLLLADPSIENIQEYLKRGECFISYINNQIIGAYVLLPTRPSTIELINVAVTEDHQGKGIGKQLILHAIHTARQSGYKTMELGTGNSSIGQLYLYQKCGFRIVGVDIDYFVRHYSEEIYENGLQCRDMIRLAQDL